MIQLSEGGLELLLKEIGVEVHSDTATDIICYCPIHLNRSSPALNVSKTPPYPFRCWNPSCAETGTVIRLVMKLTGKDLLGALSVMKKYRASITDLIKMLAEEEVEDDGSYPIISEDVLERVKIDYEGNPERIESLTSRGFSVETISAFKIGYSAKRKRLTIPVWDENGDFVGFSGRSLSEAVEPKYWDFGLPKRYILFNLNNARSSDTVVVVEGPLDAMKVWQAGFHNVVAFFGGGFSKFQGRKLTTNFSEVIIFTDNDEAGHDFIERIAKVCRDRGRRVFVAKYEPEWEETDPGALSEGQITQAIGNKVPYLQYKLKDGGNIREEYFDR